MWVQVQLHEELEEWDQARIECRNIAKKWPEELDMVLKHAQYCFRTHDSYDWERARELYEKAFEAYADSEMLGEDVDEQWTHLNVYLDILLRLGMYHEGIRQLRRLARWFLGRKDDTFWDDFIDDREFDSTHASVSTVESTLSTRVLPYRVFADDHGVCSFR